MSGRLVSDRWEERGKVLAGPRFYSSPPTSVVRATGPPSTSAEKREHERCLWATVTDKKEKKSQDRPVKSKELIMGLFVVVTTTRSVSLEH